MNEKKEITRDDLKARTICKKCGKDIEYLKTVEAHQKCPRCGAPLGRDLAEENKEVKRIINYDFILRYRKYLLYVSLLFTVAAVAYNVVGFFLQLFAVHGWWLALMSLPLVILSILLTNYSRTKSESKRHRILAWLVIVLNVCAIAAIIVTSIPVVNDKLAEVYSV